MIMMIMIGFPWASYEMKKITGMMISVRMLFYYLVFAVSFEIKVPYLLNLNHHQWWYRYIVLSVCVCVMIFHYPIALEFFFTTLSSSKISRDVSSKERNFRKNLYTVFSPIHKHNSQCILETKSFANFFFSANPVNVASQKMEKKRPNKIQKNSVNIVK